MYSYATRFCVILGFDRKDRSHGKSSLHWGLYKVNSSVSQSQSEERSGASDTVNGVAEERLSFPPRNQLARGQPRYDSFRAHNAENLTGITGRFVSTRCRQPRNVYSLASVYQTDLSLPSVHNFKLIHFSAIVR